MKYDFETIMERKGFDAMALDAIGSSEGRTLKPTQPKEGYSVIPMWIADMNFATAPSVTEQILQRASHPAFGYFYASDEFYQSIISWHKKRHGMDIQKENIGYENGVLGCIATALCTFLEPGQGVLLHSPAYVGFSNVLKDTGRKPVLSPLKKDEQGIWRMDYEDMEQKIRENEVRAAIFCSPHNPCGRVWEKWEIKKAMQLFQKYDVLVLSDEIWSDLVFENHTHIPAYSISDDAKMRTISIYAPSKTFNLAGLTASYHLIFNPEIKKKMEQASAVSHYNSMNVLSMHALIGAYSITGEEWLEELNAVLEENTRYMYQFFKEEIDGISLSKPEGTYMLFLHCEEYCKKHNITLAELVQKGWDVGVAWQNGEQFYDPWGIRINCAVPFSLILEAIDRLKKHVFETNFSCEPLFVKENSVLAQAI
jgi:cystathionine beta-lyase